MNNLTSSPRAAQSLARRQIADEVAAADARAARRAACLAPRRTSEPERHDLPWWAFRFLFPVR